MTLLVAILVFLVVILFHEGGHFSAAKSVGIRVNEFSVGMGPALWQKEKGETTYSLRAIPLGGYCAMEGEEEDSDAAGSFRAAKPWQRFLTVLAGPVMNLVVAYVCFALFIGMTGMPQPVIESVVPGSPAEVAGFAVDDRVIAIDQKPIKTADELSKMIAAAGANSGTLSVTVERGDVRENITVKPDVKDGQGSIGIRMQTIKDPLGAIVAGWTMLWTTFASLFDIIGRLISGAISMNALSGPIGVVSMIGQAAQKSFADVLFLTGYISVNLAFFNLIPIPALDGFTLLLILLEKLRGKPLKDTTEARIKIAGFAILMGLILFVSFKDVVRLF